VALELRDYIENDSGGGISGWTVNLRNARKTGPAGAILYTTATNADGMWEFVDGSAGVTLTPGQLYDVDANNGTSKREWRGYVAVPQAFTDLHVAANAGILPTKIAAGTLVDTGPADNVAANLQDRLSDMVAQIKALTGQANWYATPIASIAQAWAKFHATTGHTHSGTGTDAPVLPLANLPSIPLTSLPAGSANAAITPDGVAANLDDRLNDIVAQLRQILGTTPWYGTPPDTLLTLNTHRANTANVHGLPAGISPLGCGGSGQILKFGTAVTGAQTSVGSPTIFQSNVNITFSPAFPTACDAVVANTAAHGWVVPSGIGAGGFNAIVGSTNTGVNGINVYWIAIGH